MEINTKTQTLNPKQEPSNKEQRTKRFDLEERTTRFAKRISGYLKRLPKCLTNIEVSRQMIRSAGSVGANYIEANECLSRKDFVLRIKISKKEARETRYWLNLTEPQAAEEKERDMLIQETDELMKIFGSIIQKCQ